MTKKKLNTNINLLLIGALTGMVPLMLSFVYFLQTRETQIQIASYISNPVTMFILPLLGAYCVKQYIYIRQLFGAKSYLMSILTAIVYFVVILTSIILNGLGRF